MRDADPLDEDAVEGLTAAFLTVAREHYFSRPMTQATVLEVLNALGIAAGFVIIGTEAPPADQENLRTFVMRALDQQVEAGLPEVKKTSPEGEGVGRKH